MGQMSTSAEAWAKAQETLPNKQQHVMATIAASAGLTDDELRNQLAVDGVRPSKSGPATRRGELVQLGLVRIKRDLLGLPVRRPSDLGGAMTVWEVVPGDEYTGPLPEREAPDFEATKADHERGMAAARARSLWEIGTESWAEIIVRAYLDPEGDAAELAEEMNA